MSFFGKLNQWKHYLHDGYSRKKMELVITIQILDSAVSVSLPVNALKESMRK